MIDPRSPILISGSTFHLVHEQTCTEPAHYRDEIDLTITTNGAGTEIESFNFEWTQTQYGSNNTVTDIEVRTFSIVRFEFAPYPLSSLQANGPG